MSSSAAAPKVILSPDRLPPEVSSTLTALWLSIGFGIVALLALWPMMLSAAPAVFPDVKDTNNLSNLGWMALGTLIGSILIVGILVSLQVRHKKKAGLRFLRLSMLGGMAVGLLIVGGIVFVIMQAQSQAPLGPAPMISLLMLGLAGLLPFGFAIFALSYAGTDPVEAYFRPEAPPEEVSYAGMGLAAAPGAVGEVAHAAHEEPAHAAVYPEVGGLDPALQQPAYASATPTESGQYDPTRETAVLLHTQEAEGEATMLRPASGAKRDTMLAPSGDALDAILSEEIAAGAAPATAAPSDGGGAPLSPEALDAIFSGEEGEAPDMVPGGADREHPGSFSDSIFDEDELPPEELDHGQPRGRQEILPAPDSKATGESSIFSEANPMVPGSGVISGMVTESAVPEIILPESGQALPPAKPKTIPPASKSEEEEEKKEEK
jgi:hypothetical protein